MRTFQLVRNDKRVGRLIVPDGVSNVEISDALMVAAVGFLSAEETDNGNALEYYDSSAIRPGAMIRVYRIPQEGGDYNGESKRY